MKENNREKIDLRRIDEDTRNFKRKSKTKKSFVIECKFPENCPFIKYFKENNWRTWGKYKTEKHMLQAFEELKKSRKFEGINVFRVKP